MSTEVLLQYKRDGEGYDGIFFVNDVVSYAFKGLTFAQKMTYLHNFLVELPSDTTVKLQRAESASTLPIFMEQNMVDLLRTDPAKYIEAHTIPHRTLILNKSERTSKLAEKYVVPAPAVRAGHDTLAAAFGDVTYLSYRNNRMENPFTGRWCPVGEFEQKHGIKVLEFIQQDTGGWVTIPTERLLGAIAGSSNGYYLPREWNEHGPWVSRDELLQKYNQYKKDRDQCLAETKRKTL